MNWPRVKISQVADIVSGATPKTVVSRYWDGDIPWVTPADLSNLAGTYIKDTSRKITAAGLQSCSATILPANSVVFSSRAPIGHVAINKVPMATNQGFKSFVIDLEVLLPEYLYWWLKAHRNQLEAMGTGATFKEVSKSTVSRIEIPLPPLDEQKRIAAILNKADALRAKRRHAITLLDSLTQSIFLEMFGDPVSNPMGWGICRIGDLLESANYGTSGKAGPVGKYPILRMGNVTFEGRIDTLDLKYIDLGEPEVEKYTVRKGDILFNRTNSADLVGKTAVFDLDGEYAFAGYLVRARVNGRATPDYISAYLNSSYGKGLLRGMAKSIVGMANINAKEMQNISIPAPPKALQEEFSGRLGRVAEMRHRILPSVRETDFLFASLQHRAFTGQL